MTALYPPAARFRAIGLAPTNCMQCQREITGSDHRIVGELIRSDWVRRVDEVQRLRVHEDCLDAYLGRS